MKRPIIGLIALTLLAFYGVVNLDFVNYDDPEYVTKNPMVNQGLTLPNIAWALTTFDSYNWHPLTWLSLQWDAEFFWPHAWGFHLSNLFFHTVAVVFLFLALFQMTGAIWRSAFVAAVLAVHPLRVESVAWVTERKDVLSVALGMAALWSYARYVFRPSRKGIATVAGLLALSLLAKPTMVTLPCVFLLLDYWPLERFQDRKSLWPLVKEKLPLFLLVTASSVMTLLAQIAGNAVRDFSEFTLSTRLATAMLAYVRYLNKFFFPVDLIPFYPHLLTFSWVIVSLTLFALISLSVIAITQRKKRPYLFVGWFWYLGTLFPMVGIIQVGWQSMADRYTYVPLIGITLSLTWFLVERLSQAKWLLAAAGSLALAIMVRLTQLQLPHWQNGFALWNHTLKVSPTNELAHSNLCQTLPPNAPNRVETCFQEALKHLHIPGIISNVHFNFGIFFIDQKRPLEAVSHFKETVRRNPTVGMVHDHLGVALYLSGDIVEGARSMVRGIELGYQRPGKLYLEVVEALNRNHHTEEARALSTAMKQQIFMN